MKTTGLSILDVTQNINLEFIGGAGWMVALTLGSAFAMVRTLGECPKVI